MRWYAIRQRLAEGRSELLARISCPDDKSAMDDLSAGLFPGAEVWEGQRHVGTLRTEAWTAARSESDTVLLRN